LLSETVPLRLTLVVHAPQTGAIAEHRRRRGVAAHGAARPRRTRDARLHLVLPGRVRGRAVSSELSPETWRATGFIWRRVGAISFHDRRHPDLCRESAPAVQEDARRHRRLTGRGAARDGRRASAGDA